MSSIVKNFDLSRRRLDQLICFAPGSFCAAWRTSEEAVSGTAVPVKRRARKPSLVVLQYQNNTGATMGSTTGASHTVFEDDSSSEVGGVVQDVYVVKPKWGEALLDGENERLFEGFRLV